MRAMRSLSVFRCSDLLLSETLLKSTVSVKSLFSSTFSKTKVFLRLLLSRSATHSADSWHSVSADLKTRILPQTIDTAFKRSSNLNELIKRLLNGQKVLINSLNKRQNLNPKAIIGSTGLSLGLVGVCVKRNGPTLITETDLIESECQVMRNIFYSYRQLEFATKPLDSNQLSLKNIEFGQFIGKGCNAVVYSAKLKSDQNVTKESLAVKMLFNFEAESNATDVWKTLNKECVPFTGDFAPEGRQFKREKLDPHPNVVNIMGVFIDKTPQLEDALQLYPDALPMRMGGFARNMTLFIVEKRYDLTLKQYLSDNLLATNTSIALLTQLLEGISFLVKRNITHRDLKTDNILLTVSPNSDIPWLVITDFGSCLTSLRLSFSSDEVCRGGNRALMAPEIICAQSGPFITLDYSRSDLWAVGAIAYELFNGLNPFYAYPQRTNCLQNISYKESELPETPETMPPLIQRIVFSLLRRDPKEVLISIPFVLKLIDFYLQRIDVDIAVTVCQISLHMSPSLVLKLLAMDSESKRIKLLFDWLKTLSIKTLSKPINNFDSNLSDITFKLRVLFLSNVKIKDMNSALNFMANVCD